jgi:hypothetical protein
MASRRRLVQRYAFASHAVHHHRLRHRPLLEILEARVVSSTFTVNRLEDAGSGSNDAGDLRYCINQANANHQAGRQTSRVSVTGPPSRPRRGNKLAASPLRATLPLLRDDLRAIQAARKRRTSLDPVLPTISRPPPLDFSLNHDTSSFIYRGVAHDSRILVLFHGALPPPPHPDRGSPQPLARLPSEDVV